MSGAGSYPDASPLARYPIVMMTSQLRFCELLNTRGQALTRKIVVICGQ